ncbi:MAG: hypothetical protein ACJ74G_04735 [Blastocatellia bacterium]
MSRITRAVAIAIILSSLIFAACHKGGSDPGKANPEEAKKNAELEKTAPHLAQTTVGDIERINLAISGAMEGYRQHKWADVVAQLNNAKAETVKGLADTPERKKTAVMREALDDMKAAVDRTLQAAENRSPEVESQLRDLQTRALALKMLPMPRQAP